MATTDENTGNLFEGLISGEDSAKDLVTVFATNNIQIVSPTVAGLLSGFEFTEVDSFTISGCDVDFESNIVTDLKGNKDNPFSILTNNQDLKEAESAQTPDFILSIESFVRKVKEIRSSYLPKELYSSFSPDSMMTSRSISEMESYENAFMRMLGMPDDLDIGDKTKKIIYVSPTQMRTNISLTKKIATLAEITGENISASSDKFSDIIRERQRLPNSKSGGGRYFDFGNVKLTNKDTEESAKRIAEQSAAANGDNTVLGYFNAPINYYEPAQLFRFYYLKCVPIQDSKIYGCISNPEKIILKPFDSSSSRKINGVKVKTSFLETIIRIRLDKVTGAPNIYSSNVSKNDSSNKNGLSAAENLGEDSITAVECFLLQKLKKILFELAKKYVEDTKLINKQQAVEHNEKNTDPASSINPSDSNGGDKPNESNPKISVDIEKQKSELKNLEILKAREDAILFLLKDTSSSSDSNNYATLASSLDMQEGIIRTSSGFTDPLSSSLYSIISQRSQYLDKKIKELSSLIDSSNPISTSGTTGSGISHNPTSGDRDVLSYLGICSEDFIIYAMALLSLNQDFLIGLLPQENRLNLALTISNSVLNSKKDPYGILARVSKSPEDGGYPSVVDSVNALALLVSKFYELYISYIVNRKGPLESQIALVIAAARAN